MPSLRSLNLELLAVGLAAGTLVVALARPERARPTYPLLATLVVVPLLPRLDLTLAVGGVVAVVGVAAGWAARDLARSAPAPVLATATVVALVGTWAAVPDTEAVLVALGLSLPAAVVAVVARPDVGRMIGWPLLALALAVVVGGSSDEQLPTAIGGLGCLLAIPAVAVAARLQPGVASTLDLTWPPAAAAPVVVVPLAATAACARVATTMSGSIEAAALAVGAWALGVLGLAIAGRALRPPPPPT